MDTDGPTDVRRTFKNFYFLEVEGNFWDTFLKAEPGTSYCQLGLMDLKHTFEICHSAFCTPHSLNINRRLFRVSLFKLMDGLLLSLFSCSFLCETLLICTFLEKYSAISLSFRWTRSIFWTFVLNIRQFTASQIHIYPHWYPRWTYVKLEEVSCNFGKMHTSIWLCFFVKILFCKCISLVTNQFIWRKINKNILKPKNYGQIKIIKNFKCILRIAIITMNKSATYENIVFKVKRCWRALQARRSRFNFKGHKSPHYFPFLSQILWREPGAFLV